MRKYRRHVSLFVWSDVSGAWKVKSVNGKAVHFRIKHSQKVIIVHMLQSVDQGPGFCFNLTWFYLHSFVCWAKLDIV